MATEDRESSKGDSPIFVGRKLGQSPDGERELPSCAENPPARHPHDPPGQEFPRGEQPVDGRIALCAL